MPRQNEYWLQGFCIRMVGSMILLLASGCATIVNTNERNPDVPQAGRGYVDFYLAPTSNLYGWILSWNLDDRHRSTTSPDMFEHSHRSGGAGFGPVKTFIRIECMPGVHSFEIKAQPNSASFWRDNRRGADELGWYKKRFSVNVSKELVTPVNVHFETFPIVEGPVARNVAVPAGSVPITFGITANATEPQPYQKAEKMSYFNGRR